MSRFADQVVADAEREIKFAREDDVLSQAEIAYIYGFINGLVLGSRDPWTANGILNWFGRHEPWRVAMHDQWIAEWKEIIEDVERGAKRQV